METFDLVSEYCTVIALWAAVQPAKSLILGTSGLIDPPGPRLRPPDLYIIRKLSERRIRLSNNNTNFDNVALNAKFITHASDIMGPQRTRIS